ncbi:MAG: DUF5683 domain-containing protein [Flavobacteriales bacterium]
MKISSKIKYSILIVCLLQSILCFSQAKKTEVEHSPNKALLLSMALPGAGQIYNQKYWKLPILYGGFALSAYLISENNKTYKVYKNALDIRLSGGEDEFIAIYTEDNLRQLQQAYRNDRDLNILIAVGIYALQSIDAYVDAHLFNFDVSDDISFYIKPQVHHQFDGEMAMQIGFSLDYTLR